MITILNKTRLHLLPSALSFLLMLSTTQFSQAEYTLAHSNQSLMVMDASWDELATIHDSIVPDYRIKWLNIDETSFGEITYSAIFEENEEQLYYFWQVGLTESHLHEVLDSIAGLEVMQIEAYKDNGFTLYSVIAYQRSGPEWLVHTNVEPQLNQFLASNLDPDFQVVNRCVDPDTDAVTTLYKKDGTSTVATHPLSLSELNSIANAFYDYGFRLTSMDVHNGSQTEFLPVFKLNGNLRYTIPGDIYSTAEDMESLAEADYSNFTPTWLAYTRVSSIGLVYPKYMCGMLRDAHFRKDIQPTKKPQLSAQPKPLATATQGIKSFAK